MTGGVPKTLGVISHTSGITLKKKRGRSKSSLCESKPSPQVGIISREKGGSGSQCILENLGTH